MTNGFYNTSNLSNAEIKRFAKAIKKANKPKRRNRKDCIHFDAKFVEYNCDRSEKVNYECTGVSCGCFKTK